MHDENDVGPRYSEPPPKEIERKLLCSSCYSERVTVGEYLDRTPRYRAVLAELGCEGCGKCWTDRVPNPWFTPTA